MNSIMKVFYYEKFMNIHGKHKSIFRFGIVGCINTGVDFFSFTFLHRFFGIDKFLCQIAGYSLGITNSFIMNKLWTFEDRKTKTNTFIQLFSFVSINAVSLGLTLFGLKLFNEKMHLNIYLSKVFITLIAQLINYFGYKILVFK